MSLRRFQGWEPAQHHVYDEQGRLVATRTESEWNGQERGLMLALAAYRSLVCEGCGGWLPETTEPEGEHSPELVAVHDSTCRGCVAMGQRSEADDNRPHRHADRYRLVERLPG